jgi:hypothetical protein
VGGAAIVERFLAAFSAADFERMREALATEAMDLPAVRFRVELTQQPVAIGADRVLAMVEVHAERGDRTLHNFAAHLLRLEGEQIAEWWMVDAKPAESDAFWG